MKWFTCYNLLKTLSASLIEEKLQKRQVTFTYTVVNLFSLLNKKIKAYYNSKQKGLYLDLLVQIVN